MYGIAREVGVARRRLDLGMPKQFADHGQALAKRQGTGSERMTEVMKPDVLKPGARSYAIPVAVEVRQAGAQSAARNDPGIAGDPR